MTSLEPKGWIHGRERLLAEMQAALAASPNRYVNLSIPKHAVITPCLWEITFDSKLSGKSLDVRWNDGSQSSFACGMLAKVEVPPAESLTILRIGLMSFRRSELDFLVDLYACRNRELALLRSMAAEEMYSFERAREIPLDPALVGNTLVEIYHTGLEPMVVGFYRGVVAALGERQKRQLPRTLLVQPMFYAGKPERENLSADSPGAKSENYLPSKVWL